MTDKMNAWLTTYTGKRFFPFNPNPADIDICDIAHHLSNICRYAGACSRFYSVAEHSVRLSRAVNSECKLYALMHDAAEAYFSDIPRHIKHALPEVVTMENTLLYAILSKFGMTPVVADAVRTAKEFENRLVATEVRDLGINPTNWHLEQPFDEVIYPWEPHVAEVAFLTEFRILGGGQYED